MSQEPKTKINIQNFQVFPKHVGVWQGDWLRLDANGQEIARFTATVTKRIVDNQWIQTNAYHYADGSTTTHHFVGTALEEGVVDITGGDTSFSNFKAIAEEHGENLIIFNVSNKESGALIGTEMINLVRPDYCVRTSQGFAPDRTLKSFMVITEHRIAL
ncbi:MAG: DUF3598 family protein [Myxacorys chilensis ATA2-1-KO14]|jgi:hypothetical protein|nr:DUF3598 family protein [Myxacorys chilensis ATA2-1-KO14]